MSARLFADGASFRTTERRRLADLDFIARVRSLRDAGNAEALVVMARDHRHAPQWKRVCVARALGKVESERGAE